MTIARHLQQRSAGFSPASISGLQVWFKADGTLWTTSGRTTAATADGDPVGAWDDATTNGRNATQATSGQRPTLKTNQLNGKPAVRFSRPSQTSLVTATGFLTAAPITVIALIKNPTLDASTENWIGSASGNNATIGTTTTGKILVYAGSSLTGATTMSTTNAQVIVGYINGASSKGYLGGGAADVSGNAGALKYNGFTLGLYTTPSGADQADGDMFEVLAYSAALSLTDLNAIGAYLATKWGVSWTTAT